MKLTDIILEAETDQPVKVVGLAPLDSISNAAVKKATDEIEKKEKARVIRNIKAREKREKEKAETIKAIQKKAKKKAYDANRYIQKQLAKLNKTISDTYNEAFEKLSAEANSFAWHAIPYIVPNIVDRNIGSLRNEFVADYQQVGDSVKDPEALIPISAPMKARMKEWNADEVPLYKAALKRAKEIEAEGNSSVAVENNTIISPNNLMSNKDNDGRTYHQAPDGIYPELAEMYATAWDAKCEEILSNEEWMGKLIDELAKQYFDDKKGNLSSNDKVVADLDDKLDAISVLLNGTKKRALNIQKGVEAAVKGKPAKAEKSYTDAGNIEDIVQKAINKAIEVAESEKKAVYDTSVAIDTKKAVMLAKYEANETAAQKLVDSYEAATKGIVTTFETYYHIIFDKAKGKVTPTAYNNALKAFGTNAKYIKLNKLKVANTKLAIIKIKAFKYKKLKENLFTGTLKSLLK